MPYSLNPFSINRYSFFPTNITHNVCIVSRSYKWSRSWVRWDLDNGCLLVRAACSVSGISLKFILNSTGVSFMLLSVGTSVATVSLVGAGFDGLDSYSVDDPSSETPSLTLTKWSGILYHENSVSEDNIRYQFETSLSTSSYTMQLEVKVI